jgi:hypothetical protein
MSIAQVPFCANCIRIDIELPMHKMIDHAVECSIHRPDWMVQPGIAQDDAVTEDHEDKQDALQPSVIVI